MFELKFAVRVSDLTGTWAVGVLALEYYSGITLPALAEESGLHALITPCINLFP